ncbi:MAG TPA: PfkB family carbohydrate kinase [Rhizomicrobium sp.]|jgi:sugar/nucleoside kinase (ribokinase family)|nr:PfkB family carbohydrate kinase [Rhizomicrobium sp.]
MSRSPETLRALFVGRSTYDLCFVLPRYPEEDTKSEVEAYYQAAGGPALNAAIVFAALDGKANLFTAAGTGEMATSMRRELADYGVALHDHAEKHTNVLPISSILINRVTGTRTIATHAPEREVAAVSEAALDALPRPGLVMSDGHVPELAEPVLAWARKNGIPTLIDGGSWKDWMPRLLKLTDIAVISERFQPPRTRSLEDRFAYLEKAGVKKLAVTRGPGVIQWRDGKAEGEIHPPNVAAIDTLGAGDAFHGSFCRYFLEGESFETALHHAASLASRSCTEWGRAWIAKLPATSPRSP